jgi:hypothetical protein
MPPKSRKTLSRLERSLSQSGLGDPAGVWQASLVGALAAPHTLRHGYPPSQEHRHRVGLGLTKEDCQRVTDNRINSSPG